MRRGLHPAVLFLVLAAGLFWRVLFLGETLIATDFLHASPLWTAHPQPVRNPLHADTIEHYYPAEVLSHEHARRGQIPRATPYVFNGAPIPHGVHIWNSVWPPKLAFLLAFDPVRSYDLYAIAHWWLAGVAMAAFLRSLGIGPFAAFAGALAYALSGRAAVWLHSHYMMPTLAYAPLAFLWAARGSWLTALPVAGLFFTNPHGGLAVGAALLFYRPASWKAVAAGTALAGVALVPLAHAVLTGVRDARGEAEYFYRDGFRTWMLLADLFSPGLWPGSMPRNEYNVYVGLLPLAGALAALGRERYWTAVMGVTLAVATLYPLPVWVAPVSFSLPTRYLFLFTLGACVLFARALERRPLPAWTKAAVVLIVLADLAPRFHAWNRPYDAAPLRERPAVADVLQGGRVGWRLSDHPQLQRPVTPPLQLFGIPSVQGYHTMVPQAQAEAVAGAGRVVGGRLIELTSPEHPALDALGMRYFVTDRPFAARRFRLIYEGSVLVYENPSAAPSPPRAPPASLPWVGLAVTAVAACVCVWGAGRAARRGRAAGASG
ncbi:MAG TPA: hypothetical protein VEJ18_01535 [Planctomycetota bacterium]|nr:hypothetical protein [Planctomycetota bacterium]